VTAPTLTHIGWDRGAIAEVVDPLIAVEFGVYPPPVKTTTTTRCGKRVAASRIDTRPPPARTVEQRLPTWPGRLLSCWPPTRNCAATTPTLTCWWTRYLRISPASEG
jgi:hypothetical protein